MISDEDEEAILSALGRWFESQDISPRDAAYLCACMSGITAGVAFKDHVSLETALRLLCKALRYEGREASKFESQRRGV